MPLHFIFSPPFRFFSHSFLFPKLLISRPRRSPSLSQLRDQGPVAAIPACDSPAEGDGREFVSPFYFSSHHSDFFSQLLFFQNRSSVGHAGCPPSVNYRIKGPSLPSCNSPAEGDRREFPLPLFFPPPFQLFLMASFCKYIAHQLAVLAALPQSIKGSRAHCCQLACRMQRL